MAIRLQFFLFLFIFSKIITGQQIINRNDYFYDGWNLFLGVGPSTSFTDVKQNLIFPVTQPENEWRLGINLMLAKDLSNIFNIRGQAHYSKVAGVRTQNEYYFEAELIEGNLSVAANISNMIRPYRSDYKWFVSFSLGTGLSYYNSTLYHLKSDTIIAQRGYGKGSGLGGRIIEGIIVCGMEVDYKLNENWGIKIQSANRWMNSDSFDSKEGGFPFDFYNITTIGVTYKFYRVFYYPVIDNGYQSGYKP